MSDERLTVEREQRFWPPHARAFAAGENDCRGFCHTTALWIRRIHVYMLTKILRHDDSGSLGFSSLASSDGAPSPSQTLNSPKEWAKRHSSKTALAMADAGPDSSG